MKRSIMFAQNFLRDPHLVSQLLRKTNISKSDIVYDIGAGTGAITAALAQACAMVIAVETDDALTPRLRHNIRQHQNALVYEADFMDMILPQTPYKVFANIPFNRSADIVHKLCGDPNPPTACYLIVQREFADKLIVRPNGRNMQMGITLAARFDVQVLNKLRRTDFVPQPKVDSVLLAIVPRPVPLVTNELARLFGDFVAYVFNAFQPSVGRALQSIVNKTEYAQLAEHLGFDVRAKPSRLKLSDWLGLFEFALLHRSRLERAVLGYRELLSYKHRNRTKLHRTH